MYKKSEKNSEIKVHMYSVSDSKFVRMKTPQKIVKSKCSDTPSLNSDLDFLLGQSQIQVKTCRQAL